MRYRITSTLLALLVDLKGYEGLKGLGMSTFRKQRVSIALISSAL
jgi:hypothetical protein